MSIFRDLTGKVRSLKAKTELKKYSKFMNSTDCVECLMDIASETERVNYMQKYQGRLRESDILGLISELGSDESKLYAVTALSHSISTDMLNSILVGLDSDESRDKAVKDYSFLRGGYLDYSGVISSYDSQQHAFDLLREDIEKLENYQIANVGKRITDPEVQFSFFQRNLEDLAPYVKKGEISDEVLMRLVKEHSEHINDGQMIQYFKAISDDETKKSLLKELEGLLEARRIESVITSFTDDSSKISSLEEYKDRIGYVPFGICVNSIENVNTRIAYAIPYIESSRIPTPYFISGLPNYDSIDTFLSSYSSSYPDSDLTQFIVYIDKVKDKIKALTSYSDKVSPDRISSLFSQMSPKLEKEKMSYDEYKKLIDENIDFFRKYPEAFSTLLSTSDSSRLKAEMLDSNLDVLSSANIACVVASIEEDKEKINLALKFSPENLSIDDFDSIIVPSLRDEPKKINYLKAIGDSSSGDILCPIIRSLSDENKDLMVDRFALRFNPKQLCSIGNSFDDEELLSSFMNRYYESMCEEKQDFPKLLRKFSEDRIVEEFSKYTHVLSSYDAASLILSFHDDDVQEDMLKTFDNPYRVCIEGEVVLQKSAKAQMDFWQRFHHVYSGADCGIEEAEKLPDDTIFYVDDSPIPEDPKDRKLPTILKDFCFYDKETYIKLLKQVDKDFGHIAPAKKGDIISETDTLEEVLKVICKRPYDDFAITDIGEKDGERQITCRNLVGVLMVDENQDKGNGSTVCAGYSRGTQFVLRTKNIDTNYIRRFSSNK